MMPYSSLRQQTLNRVYTVWQILDIVNDRINSDSEFHLSRRSRGASCITDGVGGSDANAMAANVSMIRFTHSIWVTVSGDCIPMNAPHSTMRHATILTVI